MKTFQEACAYLRHGRIFAPDYVAAPRLLHRINQKTFSLRISMTSTSLSYAQALRAIGVSLEVLGISSFNLEKYGEDYIVYVTASQPTRGKSFAARIAGILRWFHNSDKKPPDVLTYALSDILRLDREQRSRYSEANVMPDTYKLAQVLRVIGDHLDRKEACAFTISMSSDAVSVWYETSGGHQTRDSFTVENLYDFAVHMYLRRSKRYERTS